MSKVYGQKPTNAISAVVRHDELADSVTQESNLKRQQSIGQIGETLPLVFCRREGNVGGTWISPRIIGVGLKANQMSLIYPLSLGQTGGLSKDQIFIGYDKFSNYPGAYENHAYEEIPSGIDLTYDPGGSQSWTEKVYNTNPSSSFPTESGDVVKVYSASKTCSGMEFVIKGDIHHTAKIYAPIKGYAGITNEDDWRIYSPNASKKERHKEEGYWKSWADDPGKALHNAGLQAWSEFADESPRIGKYADNGPNWGTFYANSAQYLMYNFEKLHREISFKSNYYVYYYVKDRNAGNKTIKSGTWEITSTTQTKKITGLKPGSYLFEFKYRSKLGGNDSGWIAAGNQFKAPYTGSSKGEKMYVSGTGSTYIYKNQYMNLAARINYLNKLGGRWKNDNQNNTSSGSKKDESSTSIGTVKNTGVGDETISASLMSTCEYVVQTLEWPDIPGGSYQAKGNYDDMTIFGIKSTTDRLLQSEETNYIIQIHAFVNYGLKATDVRDDSDLVQSSNRYPDLVNYLMRNALKLDPTLIDMASLRLISNMNVKYKLHYNGVMQTTTSYQEWAFRTSPYFWSTPTQINGKYGLAPVVPLHSDGRVITEPIEPRFTFGVNDIIQGSYNMVMESSQERQDFCCVMVYRESSTLKVAQTRTIEVRYKGKALSGPYETHDMTEFCCDVNHACRAAMYILARRRYVTHTVSVTVNNRAALLNPGDVVRLDLRITGGTQNTNFYQVDSISEGPDGLVSLAMTHFPVDAENRSLIANAIAQVPKADVRSDAEPSTGDLFTWQ